MSEFCPKCAYPLDFAGRCPMGHRFDMTGLEVVDTYTTGGATEKPPGTVTVSREDLQKLVNYAETRFRSAPGTEAEASPLGRLKQALREGE